jgi:hypothetical protein
LCALTSGDTRQDGTVAAADHRKRAGRADTSLPCSSVCAEIGLRRVLDPVAERL